MLIISVSRTTKISFIVWAPYSPRSANIAKSLGAKLYLLHCKFKKKAYSPVKYPILLYRTTRILLIENPTIIICQSPPMICAISAFIYKHLRKHAKIRVVIDAHTGSFDRPWSYFKWFDRRIIKRAFALVVSNKELADEIFFKYAVRPIVLEDRVPDYHVASEKEILYLPNSISDQSSRKFRVAVIASFAPDEPIQEILESAKNMTEVNFYMTGRSEGIKKYPLASQAENIIFTGMSDPRTYLDLLGKMDCIMVLTNRDNTLLSGAYEALALEKPLITSRWGPLKNYFSSGTVHINNSPQEIMDAIRMVMKRQEMLVEQMRHLRAQRTLEWEEKISEFYRLLTM
jgi:glycosyltransferase involved in cell wall biosynthesis